MMDRDMAIDAAAQANYATRVLAAMPMLAEVVWALVANVKAHDTGRFEPAQAAYESARAILAKLETDK